MQSREEKKKEKEREIGSGGPRISDRAISGNTMLYQKRGFR